MGSLMLGKRFLVVDDSPLIQAMIKKTLHTRGYEHVDTVGDGQEAKSKLAVSRYDMVISDYDMPNMNGGELLAHVKQYHPEVLVIMLSGQQDRKKVVSLMRQAENYIVKDDMREIEDDLFISIENAFTLDQLKRDNDRLVHELKERDRRMRLELETARNLIDEILPRSFQSSKIFEIKIMNRLSNIIGGDFYSINRFDHAIGVLLADISGHGIPAALLMLTLYNAIARSLDVPHDTALVLEKLNYHLLDAFPESKYATVSYLFLEEQQRAIHYTNEFQNPLLYFKNDGSLVELDNGNLKLLGIHKKDFLETNDISFVSDTLVLQPGERVFLFTDGVIEVKNSSNMEFGIDRVKDIISSCAERSIADTIRKIYQTAKAFSGSDIIDDVTIVGIGLK